MLCRLTGLIITGVLFTDFLQLTVLASIEKVLEQIMSNISINLQPLTPHEIIFIVIDISL